MTSPQITSVTSDMPVGGYAPGTQTATVTTKVALHGPGTAHVSVGVTGSAPRSTMIVVKSPVTIPVGATVSPQAWPIDPATKKPPTMEQCYRDWAGQFGMPMGAKAYLHSFPTQLSQDGQLKGMSACGIPPVVCFGAFNFKDLNADRAAFIDSLKFLEQTYPHGWIVFEQEPNTGVHLSVAGPGWNAAAFIALSHARYADVRATLPADKWPVLFCPSTGGTYQSVQTWYPGPNGCDGIAPDHYCGGGGSAKAMPAFQLAAQIVARDGLPAGVGWLEMGCSASTVVPKPEAVTAMIQDAASFFLARKQAGEPVAPWLWWNGPDHPITPATPAMNAIWPKATNPANNYLIPVWQSAVKQVTA